MKTNRIHFHLIFFCLLALLVFAPVFSETACGAETATQSSTSASTGKWVKKNGKVKYQYSDKTYAGPGFRKIGKYWYYFDANGCVVRGWITVNKKKYYGSVSKTAGKAGRLFSGWKTIDGKSYYFSVKNASGKYGQMLTGWQTLNKKTYYFGSNGVLRTGLNKISGKYFYFLKKGDAGTKGKMVTGWVTIKGKRYYFRPTGKLGVKGAAYTSEWQTIKGQSYYFNVDGSRNTETLTQEQFIETIGKLAQMDMKKSNILASVTIAQAILESGYGTSSLALEAHNLFGMKTTLSGNNWKSPWSGKVFTKKTSEYLNGKWCTITADFRAYSTFAESLADHSAYLTYAKNGSKLRYKGVVGNKSYRSTLKIIKKGGYATDPQYVSKLCAIIKKYKLTKYDKL